ncbi:hypothetical protein RKQ56_07385 [Acinetobacter baumannii]|uniref:hypothetical protein n=1 Tax=Acinetobacter baumannii TaxID=470 RepID=UPI00159D1097|nr:hypothetical protein [Acinetobacter baumannii]QLB35132.1 hypothetical protein GQO96_07340 [Acinetobacter baumannii]QLB36506.1 hypothetical protein GQO96_14780 [Acinetobacter baumannii]
MFEQILKHRPKGATHWQAGYYYNSDECGIWSIWENGKWHGDFKFPDGVMTKLPEEKEPAMIEFEGKSGKWAWEIQKEQQANLVELRSSIEKLAQKYKQDAHSSSLFGDQDKARVYNRFANELEHFLKGGA